MAHLKLESPDYIHAKEVCLHALENVNKKSRKSVHLRVLTGGEEYP